MSHSDPPNELVAGVWPARLALVAFVLLWAALVAWVLRNDDRLLVDVSSPTPGPRLVADGTSPDFRTEPSSPAAARASGAAVELPDRAAADVPPPDVSGSGERASGPGAAKAGGAEDRADADGVGTDGTEGDRDGTEGVEGDGDGTDGGGGGDETGGIDAEDVETASTDSIGTDPDTATTAREGVGAAREGDAGVIGPRASGDDLVGESVDGDGREVAVGDVGDAAGGEAYVDATVSADDAAAAVAVADVVDTPGVAGVGPAGASTDEPTFVPDEPPPRPDAEGGGTAAPVEPPSPTTGLETGPTGASAAPRPRAESAFEARRREELETLASLLADVAFEPLDDALTDGAREPLERAFEILFLYPRTRVDLVVESRETNDVAADRRLAGERAERVVDYLVSRGIERARLTARAGDGGGLPFGEHRVRVSVEDQER